MLHYPAILRKAYIAVTRLSSHKVRGISEEIIWANVLIMNCG